MSESTIIYKFFAENKSVDTIACELWLPCAEVFRVIALYKFFEKSVRA